MSGRSSACILQFIATSRYDVDCNLHTFDLSFFGVERLSDVVLKLNHLKILNASHNQLIKVKAANFMHMREIAYIDLACNKIYSVEYGTFSTLRKLKTLDLSHNFIETIENGMFRSNSKLSVVNLENNPFKRVDVNVFMLLKRSTVVNVLWNNVVEIKTSSLKKSMRIELNGSNEIIFRLASGGSTLRCPKDVFKRLTYLNISGNQLENTRNVIELLSSVIETLDLSGNILEKFDWELIKRFDSLENLNLSHMNLAHIDIGDTLQHLKKLKILDLSHNRLQSFNFEPVVFNELRTLKVEDNQLNVLEGVTQWNFPKLTTDSNYMRIFYGFHGKVPLSKWLSLQLTDDSSKQRNGINCNKQANEEKNTKNVNNVKESEEETTDRAKQTYQTEIIDPNSEIDSMAATEVYEIENGVTIKIGGKTETIELNAEETTQIMETTTDIDITSNDKNAESFTLEIQSASAFTEITTTKADKNTPKTDATLGIGGEPTINILIINEIHRIDISRLTPTSASRYLHKVPKSRVLKYFLAIFLVISIVYVMVKLKWIRRFKRNLKSQSRNNHIPYQLDQLGNSSNTVELIDHLDFRQFKQLFDSNPELTTIDVSYNNINELRQNVFKEATLLDTVNLSHNKISTIKDGLFINTPNINKIDMSYNKIDALHKYYFKGLSKLRQINLSHNNISMLEKELFDIAPELITIDISNNNINELLQNVFKGATQLTILNLSYNKISSVEKETFWELNELITLDMRNNFIETISRYTFRSNQKLQTLHLDNNPIKRFSYNVIGDYTTVYLLWEKVEEFDISGMTQSDPIEVKIENDYIVFSRNYNYNTMEFTGNAENITYFNVSNNKIRNMGREFSKLSAKLETLDASLNFFPELNADIFRKVIKLKHLYLSQASILNVNANTFSKLGELITLDLSFNLITTLNEDLFENNKKLKSLYLENNPLRRVDCNIFIPIMNKAVVNFTWANVTEFSTSCFKNSVEFDLDQRDELIVRMPQKSFEFPIGKEKFQKLTFLNISENQLKNAPKIIDFVGASIKTLDLSSNFIGPIIAETFERFENLVYLNLSHTNLSNFDFSTFYHQMNLEVLDLSFNRLQKVNFTLLYRNFLSLETLRLEGNELTEINSVNRAIFPKLSALGISKNYFSCDYLATFLPPWHDKVKLIIYPTNKTNIEKVDCHHGQKSNTNIEVTTMSTTSKRLTSTMPGVITEKSNLTTIDLNEESTEMENRSIIRVDCDVFSSKNKSETGQVFCDHIEEIDTSCMGSALQINVNSDDEIVIPLSQ
ncbi:uncharacterized protein LOC116347806, partial [Contarinia nasturtii]|uniref:uncharacterized protein LOC116347806 n=1 Tax=Contarinia nasturtii TaxID=265458 RepID=UPI0012D4293F